MIPVMIKNLRLKELVAIVRRNHSMYEGFVVHLAKYGYTHLSGFISESDDRKATQVILDYFESQQEETLLDGMGNPYSTKKGRWYFLAWILRDAPAQRLGPLLKSMPGKTLSQRRACLLNEVRKFVAPLLPEAEHWTWPVISEVFLARLEGSRRAGKGAAIEKVIRTILSDLFAKNGLSLIVRDKQERIDGETFDVIIDGGASLVLMPVKTRETMGGGHAYLFTRDIGKAIDVAKQHGHICIPIVIAESWGGDLDSLDVGVYVHIAKNPNDLESVVDELRKEMSALLPLFRRVVR
jgi:hypothetical protein